jgi:hypothetical protein
MDKKLLKQYKSTFHFGVSVSYEKVLWRGYGDREYPTELGAGLVEKKWKEKDIEQRIGVVVGWRWLSDGVHTYSHENGSYYTATQSIFAIEVKLGMMNHVDLVLPESLSLHVRFYDASKPMPESFKKPVSIPDRVPTMSERDKVWLRNEMKNVKRDSKGRWK